MTIEESIVDLSDTSQPIKHIQIKWINYTVTPWICILIRLVMLTTLSGKTVKDKAWKERSNSVEKKSAEKKRMWGKTDI